MGSARVSRAASGVAPDARSVKQCSRHGSRKPQARRPRSPARSLEIGRRWLRPTTRSRSPRSMGAPVMQLWLRWARCTRTVPEFLTTADSKNGLRSGWRRICPALGRAQSEKQVGTGDVSAETNAGGGGVVRGRHLRPDGWRGGKYVGSLQSPARVCERP